jgi:rod shape determining protein RodA
LIIGSKINGAKSWIGIMDFGIQPSEFAKISTIIMLSAYYSKQEKNMRKISIFLKGALIVLLPTVLILLQPDMGTALVYVPIFLVVSFAAGAATKYIMYIIITGIMSLFFIITPVWFQYIYKGSASLINFFTNYKFYYWIFISSCVIVALSVLGYIFVKKKYYYYLMYFSTILSFAIFTSLVAHKLLKSYQIMRLVVFINPNIEPRGAGWNTIQSITAVGSGGFLGKGFLNGTQSHLRYLPQQSTDFIFSIISEETGFVGCIVVFLLFLIIIARGFFISGLVKDSFGANAAAGIAGMIFFHFAVNIGMAIGLLPITGIPLFFLSYGGSALWTALIGGALLISIYLRRYARY